MKVVSRLVSCSVMTFLICYAALLPAQSPNQEQNLFACKNGWDSCDRSALTPAARNEVTAASTSKTSPTAKANGHHVIASKLSATELAQVAIATHQNMISDCWSGLRSCDHSKLTTSEAVGVAMAENQRNVSDCWNGWSSCNLSKLSETDLSEVAVAQHRRNVSQCWDGSAACDRSKFSTTELSEVIVADRRAQLCGMRQRLHRLQSITANARRSQRDPRRQEFDFAMMVRAVVWY